MSLKDWVIVLIPVIVNSIMIFGFQGRFMQLQKEKDGLYIKLEKQRKSVCRIRLETLKIYKEYIQRTMMSSKTFFSNNNTHLTDDELYENFDRLKVYVEELNFYYKLNVNIIPQNDDIKKSYSKIQKELSLLEKNFTEQEVAKLILNKIENELNEVLSNTVSEITNMAIYAKA